MRAHARRIANALLAVACLQAVAVVTAVAIESGRRWPG